METGGTEGGEDSNNTSPISACDNMKEGGEGKRWEMCLISVLSPKPPKGSADNHVNLCVLDEGGFVQVEEMI